MRALVVFGLLLVLSACGGSPQLDTPTAAPAPTIAPTAAPTAVPLAELDLEPLLIQAGDLPAGLNGAQVRDAAPEMFRKVPKATKAAYQQIADGSRQIGGVTVLLYDAQADRDAAYRTILDGMGALHVVEIGEDARVAADTIAGVPGVDLAFTRCHAFVHIRLAGGQGEDDATAYAKRLDKRLMGVVC